jgi:hypothetical protein
MPEWLILVAIILVALRIRRRHRWRRSLRDERVRALHAGQEAPGTATQAVLSRETPLESLQRRFVAGSISVEQYEAELDRMLRRPGGAAGHLDA